jgi:hypothetical protein
MQFFETIFLEEADNFLQTLDKKSQQKVMFNVRVAEQTNDPGLFKKLNDNIWEFRTKFSKQQIRILAFWDKTNNVETLVLATNGFIKKLQKPHRKKLNVQKESKVNILTINKKKSKL